MALRGLGGSNAITEAGAGEHERPQRLSKIKTS
jgi:hypothetical protein